MRVIVSGGTGALGRVLVPTLSSRGHEVVVLARNRARAAPFAMIPRVFVEQADVRKGGGWQTTVDRSDAVIHLAAPAFLDGPYTPAQQKALQAERVRSVQEMVRAIEQAPNKPRVFFVASSVAIYGEREGAVDEQDALGAGWLAEMFQAAEGAAETLRPHVRVVPLRFGQLLGPNSRLLSVTNAAALPPPSRVPFSFIHVTDAAALIIRALAVATLDQPLNVVAPHATVVTLHQALRATTTPPPSGLRRLFGKGETVAKVTVLSGQAAKSPFAQSIGFHATFDTLDAIVKAARSAR